MQIDYSYVCKPIFLKIICCNYFLHFLMYLTWFLENVMMNGKYNFFYHLFWRPWSTSSSLLPFALPDVFWVSAFQLKAHLCSSFFRGKFSVTLKHTMVAELSRSQVTSSQTKPSLGAALMSLSGLLHSFCESEIWVSPSLLRTFSKALSWTKSLHILQGISICSRSARCNKLYSYASVNTCTPQEGCFDS